MAGMVMKRGERGVIGVVILCAIVIGLVSYGFADDIVWLVVERLQSVPYKQVLGRIVRAITDAFTYVKALIIPYLS